MIIDLIDYPTLRVIWWLLVGILLIGFAIMDGHDMGVGTLLPFVAKSDVERRVAINTIAPHWDGNQVWFITAGGAIFAAWPFVYATAFSGFYWAMMIVLWALFFRPVGFDYRSKIEHHLWRGVWDWLIFVGSFVPPLIFGVAFGNLLIGVPFHFDHDLVSTYTGSFWGLLNPFALLCGLVSTCMITLHGGVYLMHRTEGEIQRRARIWVSVLGLLFVVLFSLAGIWLAFGISGYQITSAIDPAGFSDPLAKTVVSAPGAWLQNYSRWPLFMALPLLGYVGVIAAVVFARSGKTLWAFILSAVGIAGVIGTAGVSMFPFIMPSSSDPRSSLTVWDATSSHLTLFIMLVVALIFVPIILIYTSWAYAVMRGKVTAAYIRENNHSTY
ncbi:cytochrome d ubiquinol oxidase subunit II [Aquirhabdus parva]|uniref:Cytochrome d ubiquinol oxidase subunit II n=1 Tax=Aquirhabdus parva TaxID=2283318 RepID=A0A345P9W3_9GAMM|nr:cytochrome d ubiquinol oxidase subunit II [Aquirhabdus parva]AXI04072.1 cytochrome d ubiquinol oxidase subunit II [Aquirhabdus parva]